MRRPESLPDGTAERLKGLLKQAKSKSEFQRIQAVYLRASTTMTTGDIAAALALHPGTVRNIHSAYLRKGEEALQISFQRGRHRRNLSVEDEDLLIAQFEADAADEGIIEVSGIKAAYEQKLGQSISKSTVYRLLARHDWRQNVPLPRHSASDLESREAYRKASR